MVRRVMEILWNSKQDHKDWIQVLLSPLAIEGEICNGMLARDVSPRHKTIGRS